MKLNLKLKLPKINLTVQLILVLLTAFFAGPYIPTLYKSFFLSVSLSLKAILLFVLPFIIFSCLFYSMVTIQGRALRFVVILLLAVCASNFISILAAYGFGTLGLSFISLAPLHQVETLPELLPLWNMKLPVWLPNEYALFLGLGFGLLFSILKNNRIVGVAQKLNDIVTVFLKKLFIPLLPLFTLGFVLKLEQEGLLNRIVESYAPIILIIVLTNLVYLVLMFGLAANFRPSVWINYLKNVVPVGILGFSTISSLATMPVTLSAAEKNTQNPEMARAIIPATVNIHLLGDSLSLPILAMAIMLTFGHSLPTFAQYLIFTQFFMLAKFAIPAVPCGTIIVMVPLLEKYLGFSSEMSAFITSIYLLFDTIITVGNVLGNSALVILLNRVMGRLSSGVEVKEKDAIHIKDELAADFVQKS